MAKGPLVEFKRGDGNTKIFKMPFANWTAGGTLYFGAKLAVDDDASNAKAVINRAFTDANQGHDGTTVTYTCYFPPADTEGILMAGKAQIDYVGEFKWVSPGLVPSTFPGNSNYLDVRLYANVLLEV